MYVRLWNDTINYQIKLNNVSYCASNVSSLLSTVMMS